MTVIEKRDEVLKVYEEYEKEWFRTGVQSVNEYYDEIKYETNFEVLESLEEDMKKEIEKMKGMKNA